MERTTDSAFGQLELEEDYDRWLRDYEIDVFSRKHKVVLIVEGNDGENQIYPEQRNAFERLERNKEAIVHELEKSLFAYYRSEASRTPEFFEGLPIARSIEELTQLLELRWIRFPMVYDKGQILYGFLFDCSWDQEHGLAARYDNKALSIGQQDILP
jgi:hypothetical protein